VTISVCDSAGQVIGSKVIQLMPHSKQARVISEWVPEAYPLVGGYIKISAPEEIMCFSLFGSPDLSAIAGIGN